MRVVRLAAIIMQAEHLRYRQVLRRRLYQGALLTLSAGLLVMAAVAGEVAIYTLLVARLEPAGAAGCLAGGNFVLALLLVTIAFAASPGAAEQEAAALAKSARGQIVRSLGWASMASLLIGRLTRRK